MAGPKKKHSKHIDKDQQKTPETDKKKINVSDIFLDELKGAFDRFDKISKTKRVELYGDTEYLEQFRAYFKKEHPNLLDKIDKKDLPVYIQALEDLGFPLKNIIKKPETLQKEFGPEETEQQVMQKSLDQLHEFCDDSTNNIPNDAFSKFASSAGFHPTTHVINADGKLKTIDNLYPLWKSFLEKEHITLGDTVANQAASILVPNYNPTERIMVEVALKKIRKTLTGKLKTDFDEIFSLPIDIFSPYQDIISFKNEWLLFLDQHQSEIDEGLAKKLDAIVVTNGDIQKVLLASGKKFDDTRGFSEREQYFRRIYNKLATRQLFEEVQKTQESIDHYVEAMGATFKEFPPYVNEILSIYPFNDKEIAAIDSTFHDDIGHIDIQISDLQNEYSSAPDDKREELRKKIRALKQEREHRRRQAYIAFLRTKDAALADIFTQLVGSKFDFSVLSVDQQQVLINTLVKHKLEDTIKNKVPELLSVTEENLTQFINDLFDLKKMDITIPTRTGPIPLSFVKKEFLASAHKELQGLNDLENIKNLPLNFVTQLTDSNAAFFEEGPVFDSLYTDFNAKNGAFRLNDAYKVRIKKDGKIVEGYLSAYCPLDEYNTEEYDGKQLYLYTQPITAPNQERELATRPHEEGKPGVPVVIKDDEQAVCDVEILDKKINLNGDAFGALLFGYVLGQQSMAQTMSPKKEEELGKKLGKLDVYREKEEGGEEEPEPVTEQKDAVTETSEKDKFFNEWKQLKGYEFSDPQYKDNFGFVKGTRLLIPFADSEVEPQNGGRAWLQMEITDINEKKGTFTTKIRGGELGLGKYESKKREMPINGQSIATIKKIFGDTVYKFPPSDQYGRTDQMNMLNGFVTKDLDKSFGSVELEGGKFVSTLGDQKGEEITHFGRYEQGIGEKHDEESGTSVVYKIKHNPNKTITVTGEMNTKGKKVIYAPRDMDYAAFMIFVKEKGLQPKTKKQAEAMKQKPLGKDQETPSTKGLFSINNILGFFTNSFNKVKDNIKKYDEERTDDLTDLLTDQGRLYSAIGKILPFSTRMSAGFETLGAEYLLDRDSRIWKKVEKRKKFYEDSDFSMIYEMYLKPMIQGKIVIKPHYKVAAMLLAMIAKGKGPYNRNPEFAAKGMRVNILMGPAHQQRYLNMREKLIRELEQGSSVYGGIWTDNKKNEILELEMKYIVHVMDGRQLGIQDNDKTKNYFYGKYSHAFIDELEKGYTGFFSQSTVDEGFSKVKGASFEFARGEYFRLLGDRPQQAVPFLKVMATKAVSDSQRKTFEMAVMAGMLSGIFLTMTMSETQGMIKNICRTRGFVPGIRVKDINQQTKLQNMLDIFSGGAFSKTGYSSKKFSFRDMSGGTKDFVKRDAQKPGIFQSWISKGDTLDKLSKFFKLTGKNPNGKTLLDIYADPKTPLSDKTLIEEFLNNSNEENESLDPDVRNNPTALAGSILTKSQSAVHEMMKFNQNGFNAKDGDEKQTMQAFFLDMQKSIPQYKLSSSKEVKIFMDKFFNRFSEKGFSLQNKTELVKRLKRCQNNSGRKEVDNVLYYSIVGQVCGSLGHVTVPDEFQGALSSWKEFFKHNLDTILQPDILTRSFGSSSYKQDYDKYTPMLEPWENCVNLLDRDLKQVYLMGLPPEQRKSVQANFRRVSINQNYLNTHLYKLADDLQRNCGIDNLFRNSVDLDKSSKVPKGRTVVTGAKIKNADVVDRVRSILEGKPIEEENPDEYIPIDDDPDYGI